MPAMYSAYSTASYYNPYQNMYGGVAGYGAPAMMLSSPYSYGGYGGGGYGSYSYQQYMQRPQVVYT